MTSNELRFSPSLLDNFQGLKARYFSGAEQLEFLANSPKPTSLYLNRWKVTWMVVTAPLNYITAIFVNILSYFTPKTCGRKLEVKSNHLFSKELNWLLTYFTWGSQFRVPSFNGYRLEDDDIYTLDSVPIEKLTDPRIRTNLHPLIRKADFHARIGKGLCHGGVSWFNYLFLKGLEGSKLASQCETYLEFGEKIASLFVDGQPKQAAILQSLHGLENRLFPLEKYLFQVEIKTDNSKETIKSLTQLSDGVYYIAVGKHALSYVKAGKEQFVWNPSDGLITIANPKNLMTALLANLPSEGGVADFVLQREQPSLISRACAWIGSTFPEKVLGNR